MAEEKTKKVEEPKQNAEPKATLELSAGELFQLHLCVVSRTSAATIKWANAASQQEQDHAQRMIAFLTGLSIKLQNKLKEISPNDKKESNE